MNRKVFRSVFTIRQQDTGWSVIQANSLLRLAIRHGRNASFLMYAALEMRNAVEQQIFTVICVAHGGMIGKETIAKCQKSDGLFTVLGKVEPHYTLLCRYARALHRAVPEFPLVADWDIKVLKRSWHALSEYCHCPLVASITTSEEWFLKGHQRISDTYDYMAGRMSTGGTGFLSPIGAKPAARRSWEEFRDGKISEQDVYERALLLKGIYRVAKACSSIEGSEQES